MPGLTVRRISEETHRALRMRATRHGRSTEAEVRFILEEAVKPASRLKIGSEIHRIAREVGGMDDLEVTRQRSRIQGANLA
jgi:plasmid stability protein